MEFPRRANDGLEIFDPDLKYREYDYRQMNPMITLHELHNAIGGRLQPGVGTPADTAAEQLGPVVIDSRQVESGNVFWALVGSKHSGADFVGHAFQRGAAGAVVSQPVEVPPDRWVLEVDDTQKALWDFAKYKRSQFTGNVIAVAGSVGKTTTRQMIHTVLQSRFRGTASPRNYNNNVGTPLSMLQIEPDHEYAVLELGASARGEIAQLAELCAPTTGVITNVRDAHLGSFGSKNAIARSKLELLASLGPDGRAVLGDDPGLRRLATKFEIPVTWVGRTAECDVMATDVSSRQGELQFRVADQRFNLPVWGRHHLNSALVAVAVGRLMGLGLGEISDSLMNFDPVPMRCEVTDALGATVINDAYNSSPAAMQAALELLRDFDAPGQRVIVCGDMGELGDHSATLHRRLGSQVVTVCGADVLIACGDFATEVVEGARNAGMPTARSIVCRTPEETVPHLGQMVLPGDVVLIKGARSMGMERIVDALQQPPESSLTSHAAETL